MRVAIVTIGTELLEGLLDGNAAYLARSLTARGMKVREILTVGDRVPEVCEALARAAARADAVVATGGLGVTPDDVTRQALARLAGRPLAPDAATRRRIKSRYERMGRALTARAAEQALAPRGARLLPNPVGLAPGIALVWRRKPIYALPGVPPEMRAIAEASVFPALVRAGRGMRGAERLPHVAFEVLALFGQPESDVADRVAPLMARFPAVSLSYLPGGGALRLVVAARAPGATAARRAARAAARALRRLLGHVVFASGTDPARALTLEETVGRLLAARKKTLAVAESLTGGRIGTLLTRVPGSSRYVDRVVVTYSNRAKVAELGVPAALIARHGAVSAEVAEAMARGVRRAARVDLGLATTGIAGPAGGSAARPVGLVYVAVAGRRGALVRRFTFGGARDWVQARSALAALNELRLWLEAERKRS